jgi:ABC-type antimicrobial peptide transport system permease subunit
MERTRKRGVLFFLMVAVVVYVLLSAAIAIATVDKCGDESAAKHWNFVPPSWECEGRVPFR